MENWKIKNSVYQSNRKSKNSSSQRTSPDTDRASFKNLLKEHGPVKYIPFGPTMAESLQNYQKRAVNLPFDQ